MAEDLTAYHLNFSGPIHSGLESIGQERIDETTRSDTLWGAIMQCWLLLFDYNSSTFFQKPPFHLTSCFPFINGSRFFPLPIGSLDNLMEEVSRKPPDFVPTIKDLKKVHYISENLILKMLTGSLLSLPDLLGNNGRNVYPPFRKDKSIFSICVQRPRVRLNQLTGTVGEDAFFSCTDEFLVKGSGLFFLATFETSKVREKFEAALRLLGDTGLGADRSIGKGHFTFDSRIFSLPPTSDHSSYYLLSLYRPSKKEVEEGIMSHPNTNYSLIRRSGRAGSSFTSRFRRADAWMLCEGSILPFKPVGTIPVVLKEDRNVPHNVYRCGRAFTLPISKRGRSEC